jgi:uncharacterized Zn finger protein
MEGLKQARGAYRASARRATWSTYLAQLMQTHGQKRKLMDMLERHDVESFLWQSVETRWPASHEAN